jgi:hypothetical protein
LRISMHMRKDLPANLTSPRKGSGFFNSFAKL